VSLRDFFNIRKDPEEEIKDAYHELFASQLGRKVLAHMLVELHFFDEAVKEEEVILSNYSRRLLSNIGIWRGGNVDGVVASLLKLDYKSPKPGLQGDEGRMV